MTMRIGKILSAGLVMAVLAGVWPSACLGWSLSNPFASESNAKKKTPTKSVARTKGQEPSMLDKAGASTKNFFSKTGETLGLKKPESKRVIAAHPKTPVLQTPQKKQAKPWYSPVTSLFQPEEPERPKTVHDWMQSSKQINP